MVRNKVVLFFRRDERVEFEFFELSNYLILFFNIVVEVMKFIKLK